MTLDDYQAEAKRTLSGNYTTPESGLTLGALGLAGETGEVVELVKKHLFHATPLDREKLAKELGDVLWYLAAIAIVTGLSLDDVAARNVAKLRARFPDGWDPKAAQAKADERPHFVMRPGGALVHPDDVKPTGEGTR